MIADYIRRMFTEIRYSEVGTTERTKEEQSFMFFFIDYLDDCERGIIIIIID